MKDENIILDYRMPNYSEVSILEKNIKGLYPVVSFWFDYSASSVDIDFLDLTQLKKRLETDINYIETHWDNEVDRAKKTYRYPAYTKTQTIKENIYDYQSQAKDKNKLENFILTLNT